VGRLHEQVVMVLHQDPGVAADPILVQHGA
jgi:hypothetical protein